MSDLLTNDQLNDLLGQNAVEGAAGLPKDSEAAEPDAARNYRALSRALDMFCEQGRQVLHTVLNKEISFSADMAQKCDPALAQTKISGPLLGLKVPFKTGLPGHFYVILTKKDVAILSDLMMMGDGSAAYVDDHKDAISELFSQVLGSFSVTLSAKLGMSVGGGQVEVQEFGFTNAPISLDAYDMAVLSMKVPSLADSSIIALISSDLGDELAAKMGDAAGEAGEPPAMTEGVGLSSAELDDLAKVSQPGGGETTGDGGFSETSMQRISSKTTNENLDALLDVDLDVSIELGKASLSIKKVLELAPGSIVELDKMAGEPVDLLVNNKVVAKGEVVVVDENFGIRIVSLVSTEERIRSLR